jgi:hypothetical protein
MSIEAMKLALEALKELKAVMPIFPKDGDLLVGYRDRYNAAQFNASEAAHTLRAAIEQAEKQEPVAWMCPHDPERETAFSWKAGMCESSGCGHHRVPLYTAPPQREWQGLTENEIKHLWYEACQTNLELTSQLIVHLARNIEAKLKEKNT